MSKKADAYSGSESASSYSGSYSGSSYSGSYSGSSYSSSSYSSDEERKPAAAPKRIAKPAGPAGRRGATAAAVRNASRLASEAKDAPKESGGERAAMGYLTATAGPQAVIAEALRARHRLSPEEMKAALKPSVPPPVEKVKTLIALRHRKGKPLIPRVVKLEAKSICKTFCYVLDDHPNDRVFIYCGEKANAHAVMYMTQLGEDIARKDRLGKSKVTKIMAKTGDDPEFWKAIDGSAPPKSIPDEPPMEIIEGEDMPDIFCCCKLNDDETISFEPVADTYTPSCSILENNKVYMFDFWTEVIIWTGKRCPLNHRKIFSMTGPKIAMELRERPSWVKPVVVPESTEGHVLRAKFCDWSGIPIASGGPKPVEGERRIKTTFDVRKMIPEAPRGALDKAPEGDDFKLPNGKVTKLFRVQGESKVPVPEEQWGQFYSGESYVMLYKYKMKNTEMCCTYFWQGIDSKVIDKGKAAALTIDLVGKMNIDARQYRVPQGKEPTHFIQMFDGIIVVHLGRDTGKPPSRDTTHLYHCREGEHGVVRVTEVPPEIRNLNSNDFFVILGSDGNEFVWYGREFDVPEEEENICQDVSFILQGDYDYAGEVKEGTKGEKYVLNVLREPSEGRFTFPTERRPRLWNCTSASGDFSADEIVQFTCDDLDETHLAILDTGMSIMFVWTGKKASLNERLLAYQAALDYVNLVNEDEEEKGNGPRFEQVIVVNSGDEIPFFKHAFYAWKDARKIKAEPPELDDAAVVVDFLTSKFTLEELQDKRHVIRILDPTNIEDHLTDEDFAKAFKMSREEFAKLGKWKKDTLKKGARLF